MIYKELDTELDQKALEIFVNGKEQRRFNFVFKTLKHAGNSNFFWELTNNTLYFTPVPKHYYSGRYIIVDEGYNNPLYTFKLDFDNIEFYRDYDSNECMIIDFYDNKAHIHDQMIELEQNLNLPEDSIVKITQKNNNDTYPFNIVEIGNKIKYPLDIHRKNVYIIKVKGSLIRSVKKKY